MLHDEGKAHFAQFALNLLPAVGRNAVTMPGGSFAIEPLLEAVHVDILHSSIAHAGRNKGIRFRIVIPQTDSAWILRLLIFLFSLFLTCHLTKIVALEGFKILLGIQAFPSAVRVT